MMSVAWCNRFNLVIRSNLSLIDIRTSNGNTCINCSLTDLQGILIFFRHWPLARSQWLTFCVWLLTTTQQGKTFVIKTQSFGDFFFNFPLFLIWLVNNWLSILFWINCSKYNNLISWIWNYLVLIVLIRINWLTNLRIHFVPLIFFSFFLLF
jgi:hypothetical protein